MMIVKIPNVEELKKNSMVGYIHFKNKTNGNQSVAQFGNKESFLKFKEEKLNNDINLDIIGWLLIPK